MLPLHVNRLHLRLSLSWPVHCGTVILGQSLALSCVPPLQGASQGDQSDQPRQPEKSVKADDQSINLIYCGLIGYPLYDRVYGQSMLLRHYLTKYLLVSVAEWLTTLMFNQVTFMPEAMGLNVTHDSMCMVH